MLMGSYLEFVDGWPITVQQDQQTLLNQLNSFFKSHVLAPFSPKYGDRQMISKPSSNMVFLKVGTNHVNLHRSRIRCKMLTYQGQWIRRCNSFENRSYHPKILLITLWALFNSTKDKGVPERIKLVASVVHYPCQITVDLFRAQRVPIIPHMIRQTEKKGWMKGFRYPYSITYKQKYEFTI